MTSGYTSRDLITYFSQPIRALYDFIEFDNAIAKAVEMTDPEETLILVSADHRFESKHLN